MRWSKIAAGPPGDEDPGRHRSPYPGNPRQGDVGAIAESLRRFGQQKPIVVQESSPLHRRGEPPRHAAKALGWGEIAANVVEMDDRTAEAYLIAGQPDFGTGAYDEDALGEMLRKIASEGNLRGTGYDGDDVDAFLQRLDAENAGRIVGEVQFAAELLESTTTWSCTSTTTWTGTRPGPNSGSRPSERRTRPRPMTGEGSVGSSGERTSSA